MLPGTDHLIQLALNEDVGLGDITSRAIVPPAHRSKARIIARGTSLLCGLEIARQVFLRVDPTLQLTLTGKDGKLANDGDCVLKAQGNTLALLSAERTALNFLQRLTGIATLAHRYAEVAAGTGTGVRVVDTRKTTPAWRALEKYAVRTGGCYNHRSSLGEHILIKENHIAAAGSLQRAVELARLAAPHCAKIEVEAESLNDVNAALDAAAEIILLDNMSVEQISAAIERINGAAMVEISGGVTLESLPDYAVPGVDIISVGALTHSAPAADFSMIISN